MSRQVKKKRVRKGLTLVEVIICVLILAITVIGCSMVGNQIAVIRTESRNEVFLGMHNLNTAERLRQMVYNLPEYGELLNYYGTDTFGNSEINTEVYIDISDWDHFKIYSVRIESKMIGYYQRLVSSYTLTNIGQYQMNSDFNGEDPEPSENVIMGH